MTCQSTHNGSVRPNVFPDDFPQALERFKEASGMTWDEIAWLLGTTPPCGDGETRGSDPTPTISSPFRTWPRARDSDTCFHP